MAADPRPVMVDSGVCFDLYNGRSTPAALLNDGNGASPAAI